MQPQQQQPAERKRPPIAQLKPLPKPAATAAAAAATVVASPIATDPALFDYELEAAMYERLALALPREFYLRTEGKGHRRVVFYTNVSDEALSVFERLYGAFVSFDAATVRKAREAKRALHEVFEDRKDTTVLAWVEVAWKPDGHQQIEPGVSLADSLTGMTAAKFRGFILVSGIKARKETIDTIHQACQIAKIKCHHRHDARARTADRLTLDWFDFES